MTPPEIVRVGDPWRLRVFPNKYPAVERHEIIVESDRHDATFDSIDNAAEVISLYVDRYRAHADAAYVSLFKNDGGGSSLPIKIAGKRSDPQFGLDVRRVFRRGDAKR